MKQVVESLAPVGKTLLNQANYNHYYGFKTRRSKAFLTQRFYCSSEYIWLSLEGLTYCNCYTPSDTSSSFGSICEAIKFALGYGWTVYEFDTPQELMAWLAEK